MVIPPGADTITSEFAGVLAGAEMEITEVALQIINPMRNNDPVRLTVEIVVIDMEFFQGIQMTVAVEVADILFLLGVKANNRVASGLKFGFQLSNLGELLIPVRHRFQRLFLLRLATTILMLLEQFAHHTLAHPHLMMLLQQSGNGLRGQE